MTGVKSGKRMSLPPCDWNGAECKVNHLLKQCPVFISMNESERIEHLKKSKRCFNCFKTGHGVSSCQSRARCGTCEAKHNSMVHTGWGEKVDKAAAYFTGRSS